ncbi:MAG: glycosyltransferase [Chitinophagaceae bacterium]
MGKKYNSNKIVIVFIIDFLSTKDGISGGTERQLVEMLEKIDKDKFKPFLFCLQKQHNNLIYDSISVEKRFLDIDSLKSPRNVIKLARFIGFLKKNSVNIIHTFFFDSALFGVMSAKLAGIKTIITSRRDLGFLYNKRLLRLLKFINLLTDRFVVNSISVKNELIKKEKVNSNLIDIIYNGIDLDRIDQATPADIIKEFRLINYSNSVKIVGIVGNFNRKVKRIDLFIQAAAEVHKKYKNVYFMIVGGGNNEQELKTLANDLGVGNRVVFTGFKSDAVPYMKNFTIGVNTSESEGFSNTILEYMAVGIPVVATNVSGNAELVQEGKTGILVPPGNPGEIAYAICELLSDENKRHQMGIESKRIVEEKYSWDLKIKEIEDYYLNVAIPR